MSKRSAAIRLHFFSPGNGDPAGAESLVDPLTELGSKAWNLCTLAGMEAPVPPGLVLPAGVCGAVLEQGGALPEAVRSELQQGLAQLEEHTGRKFGQGAEPLLLAMRSSPVQPVPGLLDTVVNLGLTEEAAAAYGKRAGDERVGWDAYRRLVESYSVQVLGVDRAGFDELLHEKLESEGVEGDHELSAQALQGLAQAFRQHCERASGSPWPAEPLAQLERAVLAGCAAWNGRRARSYRYESGLEKLPGTALVLQAMAHGTWGKQSGAGRLATRLPATGEKRPHGQFLLGAMGADLTAGLRMTDPVTALEKAVPKAYQELLDWGERLERHFQDAQEVLFVVEQGKLALLHARPAPRTAKASLRIALDLHDAGICDEGRALCLVQPNVIDEYLHPVLDKAQAPPVLAKGMPASPGSAVGKVVFFAEHAVELAGQGIPTILVRHETSPEDIDGLKVAAGIVTAHGGLTSHAAVVARGMGKCCIVGAGALDINYLVNEMNVGDQVVKRLDWISIDGNTGEIYKAQLPQVQPPLEGGIARVLEWADQFRRLGVYANADTAEDARRAVENGAGGIGLCRTEHMFFDIDRIPLFRKMILAREAVGRSAALAELLPLQRRDFMGLFRVMDGRPVTIRLLDPPLNEFLPKGIRSQTRMSRAMGISVEAIQARVEALSENNPMMGHRGCRLAVTYPEIYQMQVRAIVEAACIVKKEGVKVQPEIMVPLVSTPRELSLLRGLIEELVHGVMAEMNEEFPIRIGTMVETPRAAMVSRAIALHADFYSFGTNDLTQMAYGFSRDDAGVFLPIYLEKHILDEDPFVALDEEGTGRLVRIAVQEGREGNPEIKLGICGEHGGEPASVKFFHRVGLDYVSCSPFRIPVARLAAGQAAVEERGN
jgi:pyruvate,orthophosphate dikinase